MSRFFAIFSEIALKLFSMYTRFISVTQNNFHHVRQNVTGCRTINILYVFFFSFIHCRATHLFISHKSTTAKITHFHYFKGGHKHVDVKNMSLH